MRQETLEALERTLLALEREYSTGDRECARRLVIEAKDHCKFALRRGADKQETLLWLMTWLENPGAFPLWVSLRKRQIGDSLRIS